MSSSNTRARASIEYGFSCTFRPGEIWANPCRVLNWGTKPFTRVVAWGQYASSLDGVAQISPGRNVQLNPYSMLARARVFDEDIPGHLNQRDERIGTDAKMVVRDALTLDATVNPDFSQVETDDPQVTVNQRFEVQFPEKRP